MWIGNKVQKEYFFVLFTNFNVNKIKQVNGNHRRLVFKSGTSFYIHFCGTLLTANRDSHILIFLRVISSQNGNFEKKKKNEIQNCFYIKFCIRIMLLFPTNFYAQQQILPI